MTRDFWIDLARETPRALLEAGVGMTTLYAVLHFAVWIGG